MIPWSKTNPQAFAGLHHKGNRLLLIFDEASEIEDIIFETAEGAFSDSDTQLLWLIYGNPTRKHRPLSRVLRRWRPFRECGTPLPSTAAKFPITNKKRIAQLIASTATTATTSASAS